MGEPSNKVDWAGKGCSAVIVSAVLSVAGLVAQCIEKKADRELVAAKQQHEIRLAYFDKTLDPQSSERALRFLVRVSTDSAMRDWAKVELKMVGDNLGRITKERDDALARETASKAKVSELEQRLRDAKRPEPAVLAELAAAKRERADLREQLRLKQLELAGRPAIPAEPLDEYSLALLPKRSPLNCAKGTARHHSMIGEYLEKPDERDRACLAEGDRGWTLGAVEPEGYAWFSEAGGPCVCWPPGAPPRWGSPLMPR